jgi:hypothetical protein
MGPNDAHACLSDAPKTLYSFACAVPTSILQLLRKERSMEPFIGQIQAFAFSFTPQGWLPCHGQLLPIPEYTVLFSLIGNTYGGDGKTTFALPKLAPLGPKGPYYFIAVGGQLPPK